ncbi:MAG: hypothetical protein ACJAS3_003589 [Roseivirga sp.]|jgi:hypothetical protein
MVDKIRGGCALNDIQSQRWHVGLLFYFSSLTYYD